MSKKHYVEFAKIIKNNERFNQDKKRLIKDIIQYFKIDNPRFNEKTFLNALK